MSFINLLPEDFITKQLRKRADLMCLALFIAVMIGVLAAAEVSRRRHDRTKQVCREVNRSYNEAAALIKQMQELESVRNKMLKKANRTVALLERVPRSYILAVITNALPKGASLKDFSLLTEAKNSSSSSGRRTRYQAAAGKPSSRRGPVKTKVSIVVTGYAGTDVEVAKFITLMAKCPLIDTVDLVYSQQEEVNDVMAREFQVILNIKPDADVISLSSKPGRTGGKKTYGGRI